MPAPCTRPGTGQALAHMGGKDRQGAVRQQGQGGWVNSVVPREKTGWWVPLIFLLSPGDGGHCSFGALSNYSPEATSHFLCIPRDGTMPPKTSPPAPPRPPPKRGHRRPRDAAGAARGASGLRGAGRARGRGRDAAIKAQLGAPLQPGTHMCARRPAAATAGRSQDPAPRPGRPARPAAAAGGGMSSARQS